MAIAYVFVKIWKEAQVNTNYAQYENLDLYVMVRNSYKTIPKLFAHGCDSCPRISNNTLRLEEPQPPQVANSKSLIVRDLQDLLLDSISKLEFFK